MEIFELDMFVTNSKDTYVLGEISVRYASKLSLTYEQMFHHTDTLSGSDMLKCIY